MNEQAPGQSPLNERQQQVASNLGIPHEIWHQKAVQDYLTRVAVIEDIQDDITIAASPAKEDPEPYPLRQGYKRADNLLRATLAVLKFNVGSNQPADPARYLSQKINAAIYAYGLKVVPIQAPQSPMDAPPGPGPSIPAPAPLLGK